MGQKHIFLFFLFLLSLKGFGLTEQVVESGVIEITTNAASSFEEERNKGVLPDNIPTTPTENSEKEERENKENKEELFKCVFGATQSAEQNHFEIINKYATELNFRHAYYLPIYALLHSWKAFLINY